jgi:hypothetical protein
VKGLRIAAVVLAVLLLTGALYLHLALSGVTAWCSSPAGSWSQALSSGTAVGCGRVSLLGDLEPVGVLVAVVLAVAALWPRWGGSGGVVWVARCPCGEWCRYATRRQAVRAWRAHQTRHPEAAGTRPYKAARP